MKKSFYIFKNNDESPLLPFPLFYHKPTFMSQDPRIVSRETKQKRIEGIPFNP